MLFDDYPLAPQLKENIAKLGWRRPTDIQYKSIPSILKGEDVLAIAQTGTGKTAAFAVPAIQKLLIERKKSRYKPGLKCLVMVPTHELAIQINEVFQKLIHQTGLRSMSLYGGVDQDPQIEALESGTDVVVATPGRMFDLRSQGHLDLTYVHTLILDEADHMLDLGFIKDIRDVTKYVAKRRQTLFFSATIDKKIKKVAYSLVSNPIRIQLSPKNPVAKNVHHTVAFIEMDDKRFFLERLVRENPEEKILVFVRTRVRAERVQKAMERVDIKSLFIHGDVVQKERFNTLEQFRDGAIKMLIATDVSARGIDIPDVGFVVNYDLPDQPENYVHRVGRTGRGKQKGYAVSFCSKQEVPLLEAVEKFTGDEIEIFDLETEDIDTTRDLSTDFRYDLDGLMQEIEDNKKGKRKKRKNR